MIGLSRHSPCIREEYIRHLRGTEKWVIQGIGYQTTKSFARVDVYLKGTKRTLLADQITGQLYPPEPGAKCLSSEQLTLVRSVGL